jgi:DNA-binding winged helix-turn-helix (wHTH) protein
MAGVSSQNRPLSYLSLARDARLRDRAAWFRGDRGGTAEAGGREPGAGGGPEAGFGKRPVKLLFDEFEFRVDSGELRRGGEVIRIQPQPARVLEALARRAGEVVSRQELQELVWGEETHVDFEEGLNYCIKQLRRGLSDHATEPRFIETVPRRGYRFLPEVRVGRSEPHVSIELDSPRNWRPLTAVPRLFVAPLVEIGRSLPFDGLGRTLTEELMSSLHEHAAPELCVLVRPAQSEPALPREGDADLLLEGTVRADNGPVEVSVRLVELEHQQQLWAKRYRVSAENAAGAGASWDQAVARTIADDVAARLGTCGGATKPGP